MLLDKFQLFKFREIYACGFYSSIARARLHNVKGVHDSYSNRVAAFKRYGSEAGLWKIILDTLREHFSCDEIIVVPPSKQAETSELQKLYGTRMVRLRDIPSRKDHRGQREFDKLDFSDSLALSRPPSGKKILLLDDVCTTGRTFGEALTRLSAYQVVPLALAFSDKLDGTATPAEWIYIYGSEGPPEEDNLFALPAPDFNL